MVEIFLIKLFQTNGATTLSITTLSITTLSIITLTIDGIYVTISIRDT